MLKAVPGQKNCQDIGVCKFMAAIICAVVPKKQIARHATMLYTRHCMADVSFLSAHTKRLDLLEKPSRRDMSRIYTILCQRTSAQKGKLHHPVPKGVHGRREAKAFGLVDEII